MIYTSPITLQVSRPTPKGYHEPLIFPLSSSITVTLQTPISQNPPNSQLPGEDDDGYLLISESDVSSWVVGMRVPYPFSHPRYDPTKFITSQKSSLYTSPRLPSLPPVPIDHKHDLKEILSKFDYRYSAAFGEYEKCLSTPVSSLDDPNCNLTEFIEIEKLKLSNHYKFFQELHSSDQTSTSNSSLEANTMGLLILVGLFGGIIMTILLVLSFILYLNYINETPLTISEIITKLLAWKSFSSIPSSNKPHQHHNLEIFHDQELGRGSNGTVVLRGLFEGRRHVAVKKMVARFHNFER